MSGNRITEPARTRLADLHAVHGRDTAAIIAAMRAEFPAHRRTQVESLLSRIRYNDAAYMDAEALAGEPTPPDDAARWRALADAEARRVSALAETFDWLRPVELPPIAPARVTAAPRPYVVVSSDHHWPLADERVEAIILQVVEALRPRAFVLNGDGPDMLALSKYPKDARRGRSWELRAEQHAAQSWWHRLATAGAAWGMDLYETEANHSGNERASRWRRWLNENAGALFTLDGAAEALAYPRFFHPAGVPVRMVDEVVLAGGLRVRHGEVVRKHGGYSARAHGDKWQASVMHGHTHRIGASMKRRPGIPGVRPDEFLRTYETGCACRLDADYAPGADWQQGFAIVAVDDAGDEHGVELVQVINGRAVVATLGATLKA